MLAIAYSATLVGTDGHPVRIEVDATRGVPTFELVGLAEATVRESRVRVKSALSQLGVDLLVGPLKAILEDGLAAGSFPDARPELDVHSIRAITMETVSWANTGVVRLSRREASHHVLRVSRAALGVRRDR